MKKQWILLVLLTLIASQLCQAQFGGLLKPKDKPEAQPAEPGAQPQYSDADKARMAEIAQRPEIQAAIDAAWNDKRNADLQQAYAINRTADFAIADNPMKSETYDPSSKLYNNPMMQTYVNLIGQSLVPKDSPNLYTFRIILYPVPAAYSLTTGSIYITTGLMSMLDSEAQLSYILAHEIAHVEQRHEYMRVRSALLENELNKEKEAKAERTKALIDVGAAIGGGLIGGMAKGANGAMIGSMIGLGGGLISSSILVHSGVVETDWSAEEENEADALGTKYMLAQGYDAREVPRLYASLDRMVSKDSRVGMGFLGNPKRVKERSAHIQELLNGALKDQIDQLVKSNGLVGSGTTFPILLAAAKRDNAIIAMQYDLFAMAQANLEDALVQRSNDPAVHYYLSRVMSMTAHTPEDKREAVTHIQDALRLDSERGAIPDLHLELAISLLTQGNSADKDQVVNELKSYVALYERDNNGQLPTNMPSIIDYFNLVGETGWYLPPGWYPDTQMMNTSAVTTISPAAVVRRALVTGGGDSAAPAPAPAPATPAARVKPASAPVSK